MNERKDITPESSFARVYLDPTPQAPVELPPPDIDLLRRKSYEVESDPLFFKWQREEGTKQEWLDKVDEIRNRYPET